MQPLKQKFVYYQRGFTIIELMIVIAVIVLIASVGLVSYKPANQTSRDNKRKADLEQMKNAFEIYKNDKGSYPITGQLMTPGQALAWNYNIYMQKTPSDPLYPNMRYWYKALDNNHYILCAHLEGLASPQQCVDSSNCVQGCVKDSSGVYSDKDTCNYIICNP